MRVQLAIATGATLLLAACSGKQIVKTDYTEKTVPQELVKAFEVKELKPAAAQPEPGTKKKVAGKHHKKAKQKSLLGKVPAAFTIPERRPAIDPLWVGEKVWMDVTWLNTTAGEFLLEVLPFKELNGRKVYDIKGTARTSSLFSMIYKAEDWVETFVDYQGWFPYKFILHGDETRYIRNNLELFDHAAKKQFVSVYAKRLDKDEVKDEQHYKELERFSQDSMSALYYARTQKMENGAVMHFPMTTQGKQWETAVTVVGREEVQTRMGYIRAIKTKIETRFNGVLQQNGDAFMWFSDDERRFLLKFQAKVKIGWLEGIAKRIEFGTAPTEGAVAKTIVPPPPAEPQSGVKKALNRLWSGSKK